jgi:hypothetical protein
MASEEEKGGPWYPDWEHSRPLAGIVVSMLAVIAWLFFILVYALYWSNNYNLFQNIIVTIVSLGIMGLVIGLFWVVWGFRHVRQWKKPA